MKTILALLTALIVAAPAHAQLFRPEAVNAAAVGAIAGAIIGHNSGDLRHNGWKGAAIGAGAGLILGSAFGDNHRDYDRGYSQPRGYVSYGYRSYPSYGHRGYYRSPGYAYYSSYSPRYYSGYAPSYTYGYPSYAGSGAVLGGVVGAIIGHNNGHHNAWRGAAIGSAAGLLLGSIADSNARYYEDYPRAAVLESVPVAQAATTTQAAPQNVTIINNYYNSAPSTQMASANTLFGR